MYVTLEPCVMCAGALNWAQIDTVYYGASDENAEAMAAIAKANSVPLVASADGLEALSALTEKIKGVLEFFDGVSNGGMHN